MLRFKWFYFFSVLVFNVAFANGELGECIELSGKEVSIPSQLGDIRLYKDNDGFHIIKDDKIYNVKDCFCDDLLRKMTREQLEVFLGRNKSQLIIKTPEKLKQTNLNYLIKESDNKEALLSQILSGGYISVSQISDGEYVLHANLGKRFWDREDKIAAMILITTAVAAISILAGLFFIFRDDEEFLSMFKRSIRMYLILSGRILIGGGAGLVGGGIIGASGAIINRKKGAEALRKASLGAGYGILLGAGIGLVMCDMSFCQI